MRTVTLQYPLFDGEKIIENASVTIENGIIAAVTEANSPQSDCLLMPGLIDAHTHMTSDAQVQTMLQNGVVATCDVCAPATLVERSKQFTIVSSAGMTMGTLHGSGYVKKAMESGAKYIKVLLFEPNLMPKSVLKSICEAAHDYGLKVAVHATSVKAESMAVSCGADILLHVPMKEALPTDLAKEMAERGIAVAPTLVMMETFAHSGRNGYMPAHYQNAENAVRTLYTCGVPILAATDANTGDFAPAVAYGTSMHREALLLWKAGMAPVDVLASATSKVSQVFGVGDLGSVAVGKKASLICINGRPDKDITTIQKIKHIWIEGEQLL